MEYYLYFVVYYFLASCLITELTFFTFNQLNHEIYLGTIRI